MLRVKSIKYSIPFDTLKTCNCAQLLMACGSYTSFPVPNIKSDF